MAEPRALLRDRRPDDAADPRGSRAQAQAAKRDASAWTWPTAEVDEPPTGAPSCSRSIDALDRAREDRSAAGEDRGAALLRRADGRGDGRGRRHLDRRRSSASGGPRRRGCAAKSEPEAKDAAVKQTTRRTPGRLAEGQGDPRRGARPSGGGARRVHRRGAAAATRTLRREIESLAAAAEGGRRHLDGASAVAVPAVGGPGPRRRVRASASAPTSSSPSSGSGGMGMVYLARRADDEFEKTSRDQADPARHGERARAPALPERAADRRVARSSQHRPAARRRGDRGRRALLRHGVRRGRAAPRVLRPPRRSRARNACASFVEVCAAVQLRPPEPGRAPGHQAEQHPGDGRRRAEAAGFRDREDAPARAALRTRRAETATLDPDADARTTRAPSRSAASPDHDGERRLLPRRRALRAAPGAKPYRDRHGVDPAELAPRSCASGTRSRPSTSRTRSRALAATSTPSC